VADSAMTVGEAIAEAIDGRSQKDVAGELGVAASTVNRWISGEYTPSYEDLARIEDACGKPRGSILGAAGYVESPTTFVEVLAMDPRLNTQARQMLRTLYDAVAQHGADTADDEA
jgi:transcriptional regulator with XRE-family HTH domain